MFWSWILTAVGITGFVFVGKKVWWAWYINLACQALWLSYGIVTMQWGFILSAFFYAFVFGKNALAWTKERPKPGLSEPVDPFDPSDPVAKLRSELGNGEWLIADVQYDAEPDRLPELSVIYVQKPTKEKK